MFHGCFVNGSPTLISDFLVALPCIVATVSYSLQACSCFQFGFCILRIICEALTHPAFSFKIVQSENMECILYDPDLNSRDVEGFGYTES